MKKELKHDYIKLVVTLGLIFVTALGCAKPPPPPPPPEPMAVLNGTEYFVHQVRYPNESASIIAGWYLGSEEKKKAVLAANPHVGALTSSITIGTPVLIPWSAMVQREPLTQSFIEAMKPKRKPVARKPVRSAKKPPAKPTAKAITPTPPATQQTEAQKPQSEVPQSEVPENTAAPAVAPTQKPAQSGATVEDSLLEDLLKN